MEGLRQRGREVQLSGGYAINRERFSPQIPRAAPPHAQAPSALSNNDDDRSSFFPGTCHATKVARSRHFRPGLVCVTPYHMGGEVRGRELAWSLVAVGGARNNTGGRAFIHSVDMEKAFIHPPTGGASGRGRERKVESRGWRAYGVGERGEGEGRLPLSENGRVVS